MDYHAIGMLELNSIAKGIECCDAMLKSALVELIDAHPICPGKYMAIVAGDVDAVKTAMDTGERTADFNLVDSCVIPNVHAQIIPALRALSFTGDLKAMGVVETFSAASAVISADAAVKAAEVELIEIRIANGMGGKSFFILTGLVGAVEAAVKEADSILNEDGLLVSSVVIPSPHEGMKDIIA